MLIASQKSLTNTNSSINKFYKDSSKDYLFRNSTLLRISLGTLTTTSVSLLYALAHARYRKFEFKFVKNWFKGGFIFSFLFYTGNEIIFAFSNYYKLYTNFWINYTGLAYFLSKMHYRYLIRNHMMKWYIAIKYSHKIFLLFLVVNLLIEFLIFLTREIYLYDEKDVFDVLKEKYMDRISDNPNFNMTYKDVEENFMKPFHVLNSKEKIKKIKAHIRKKNEENLSNREEYLNANKSAKNFQLKTVNLYDMYKNKEI